MSESILRQDLGCWPGSCIIVPHQHIPDPMLLPRVVRDNLYDMRIKISTIRKKAFGMFRDNWLEAGNLTRNDEGQPTREARFNHLHYHSYARYNNPVVIKGVELKDIYFGQALNVDKKMGFNPLPLTDEQLAEIKEIMQFGLLDAGFASREDLEETMPTGVVKKFMDMMKV